MEATISKNIFVDAYSETLGINKATSLFEEAAQAANLPLVQNYTLEEAQLILRKLQDKGGLVKIVAMNIHSRILLKGIFA